MKHIIIAGGSGFIGQALTAALIARGYDVSVLSRGKEHVQWDGHSLGEWARCINGAEAVVNLTGKSVNCRHTPENRHEIIRSRVDSVRVLGEAIAACACESGERDRCGACRARAAAEASDCRRP